MVHERTRHQPLTINHQPLDIYDPKFRERLSAFEDGELGEAEAEQLARLVASNAEAREMLAQYERLREISRAAMCPAHDALAAAVKGEASEETEAHLAECAHCRATVQWASRAKGVAAAAPAPAQEEEEPGAIPAPASADASSNLKATTIAWTLSLLIHLCLLIGAATLGFGRSEGPGEGGLEVGIVGEDDTPIEAGESKLQKIDAAPTQLTPVQVQTPSIQPIKGMEASASTGREALIALDMGSGAVAQAAGGDWSSFSAAGGGGGGSASFFGLQARGKKFVYVVDRSGSMDGPRLLAAKTELIRSISALKRNMSFLIIFYDDQFIIMPGGRLVKATESNKRKYFGWIDRISSGGGTDPTEAMKTALAIKPDVIFLLSDGEFDESACGAISLANPGGRVQIHTIGFQNRDGEYLLKRIAKQNRGQYRFVK